MASFIYTSCPDDEAKGSINFNSDTFKLMLVTSSYAADQDAHLKRSSVTNEVTGTGYTAGGVTLTKSVTKDTANNKVTITFNSASWASSTITARAGVIYKSRGGASSADELVAYIDFGVDVSSTGGPFNVSASTITKQL